MKGIHYSTARETFRQLQLNHLPCKRLADLPVSSWFLNMDLLIASSDRQFGKYNLYFAGLHRCNWEIGFLGTWCSAEVDYKLLNEFRTEEIDPFTWSLFPVKNDNLKFVTTSRPTIPSPASRRLFISVVYRITFLALATSNSPGIIYAMHEIRNKLPSLPSDAQFTLHTSHKWTEPVCDLGIYIAREKMSS